MSKTKKDNKAPAPAANNNLKSMWEWLTLKYEFKRDVVKGNALFRSKEDGSKEFLQLTDEDLNGMSLDLSLSGFKNCKPADILMFIYSKYTPSFNPIIDYLERVAKKRPEGAITKLAKTITSTAPELFEKYLRKWLVASVANVIKKPECENHMCLVFTGAEGKGKTSWFKTLCPPELRVKYMFIGELDLTKKSDTVWKLAQYWIIALEEQIKGLNKADANYMKQLITLPDIKGRKPYGRLEAEGYRLANFLASTNDEDFLNESSGSRRYPSFKILDIDYNHKVRIDDVWAEAYHLFADKNFEYWVTAKDRDELKENNARYMAVSQETEYLMQYFTPPAGDIKVSHLLPSTIIRDYIKSETNNNFLKERNIGIALKSLGYEQTTHRFNHTGHPLRVWKVHLNTTTLNSLLNNFTTHPIDAD